MRLIGRCCVVVFSSAGLLWTVGTVTVPRRLIFSQLVSDSKLKQAHVPYVSLPLCMLTTLRVARKGTHFAFFRLSFGCAPPVSNLGGCLCFTNALFAQTVVLLNLRSVDEERPFVLVKRTCFQLYDGRSVTLGGFR